MNAEILIKDEANNFSRRYRSGNVGHKGHLEFKDKLESELYNYDEALIKLIYLYQVHKNLQEYYNNHLEKCGHKDEPEKCGTNLFFMKGLFFTEQEIHRLNPEFDYTILRPEVNSNLIKENLVILKDYPEVAKLYHKAIDQLNEDRYERNLLDDLRLSIEILLRNILSNDKSLENQFESLGKYLKEKGVSKHITNLFRTLLDAYSKYQNDNIKHNDKVNEREVNLIVNLSTSMINFLAKLNDWTLDGPVRKSEDRRRKI